ncbi:MAG: enoyl-CoA hydratase/isomerase family protein [Spirochaetota bacterium]
MSLIDWYVDSQVAVITLCDSKRGNRLNLEMLNALLDALSKSIAREDVRVIALRSEGETFCLGMDLMKLDAAKVDPNAAEAAVSAYVGLLSSIYRAPKPVICLLRGEVKAGGVGLVTACDIIISSEKTSFELSEVLFGLIPANVLPFLFSLRLAPQKARYLILSSRTLTAEEAYRLNLIDELYPEEELEKGVINLIKRLLKSSPDALAETKAFTEKIFGKDIEHMQESAREKLLELLQTPSVLRAISSFNQGMTPPWFSKFKPEKPLILKKNITGTDNE